MIRSGQLTQVLAVAWLTATVFFLAAYTSPCRELPSPAQLQFYEMGGGDQDIFAGVRSTDARGLQHFPRLWCLALCHPGRVGGKSITACNV